MGESLANLRDQVEHRARDEANIQVTTSQVDIYINYAERDIARRTNYATEDYPLTVAAWDQKIALPTDTLKIHHAYWLPSDTRLKERTWNEMSEITLRRGDQSGSPDAITHYGDNLFIYPAADGASPTAAVNDGGDITTTDTTITYDGASETLATHGYYKIDDEWIKCNNNSSTQLKNAKRGWCGTTAATHADDAVITQADILIVRSHIPAVATASVTTSVPNAWLEAVILFSLWKLSLMDGEERKAQMYRAEYMEMIGRMKQFYEHRYENRDPEIQAGDAVWSNPGEDPMGGI